MISIMMYLAVQPLLAFLGTAMNKGADNLFLSYSYKPSAKNELAEPR